MKLEPKACVCLLVTSLSISSVAQKVHVGYDKGTDPKVLASAELGPNLGPFSE